MHELSREFYLSPAISMIKSLWYNLSLPDHGRKLWSVLTTFLLPDMLKIWISGQIMDIINDPSCTFHANVHFDCDCQNLELPCRILTRMENNIPKEMRDRIFDCKSVSVYNKWHSKFKQFLQDTNKSETFESVLEFFNQLSK